MLTRTFIATMILITGASASRADDDANGDPLPEGAKARLGTFRYRYGANYVPIVTPDGKTIYASDSSELRRFDISGAPLKPLPTMPYYMPTAFSADGARGVSATSVVYVWDGASGKTIITIKRPTSYFDHGSAIVDLSGNGKVVAIGASKQ